jgi:hypothetical protein
LNIASLVEDDPHSGTRGNITVDIRRKNKEYCSHNTI